MAASSVEYTISATGLDKGKKYEASVEFAPDDGTSGFNTGFSAQSPKNNGSVSFSMDTESLTRGKAGTLRGWVRLAGSGFSGDPIGDVSVIHAP